MTSHRIKGAGRLTPARKARFTFDGKIYTALEGDTVASALLANGVHLMGRSFKYHRPRGILYAGAEEPNALLDVARDSARRQPNVRASVTQRARDGSVLPSRQLRTTPSEKPHILAISVALPTRWISSLIRSAKLPVAGGFVTFCVFMVLAGRFWWRC